MKYVRKISDYMIAGGLGVLVVAGLQGCDSKDDNKNALAEAAKTQGATVIVDETAPGVYKIAEEYPSSGGTRVVVRGLDGTERLLSQSEIDALVQDEAKKIDNNTSALTNPQMSSGGMGLGGVLLSSIAGAMIGSWIGNKLFGNANYQNQRATTYKTPQAYTRSSTSFNKPAATTTPSSSATKSSGFFGGSSGTSGSSSSGSSSSSTPSSYGS
ncbi:MAG: UPF0323 family lipoprotein [Sulfurospirillum cavolei]|nr:UPF0323 family lipoprotein [Sulfurospirillum cavolei]